MRQKRAERNGTERNRTKRIEPTQNGTEPRGNERDCMRLDADELGDKEQGVTSREDRMPGPEPHPIAYEGGVQMVRREPFANKAAICVEHGSE